MRSLASAEALRSGRHSSNGIANASRRIKRIRIILRQSKTLRLAWMGLLRDASNHGSEPQSIFRGERLKYFQEESVPRLGQDRIPNRHKGEVPRYNRLAGAVLFQNNDLVEGTELPVAVLIAKDHGDFPVVCYVPHLELNRRRNSIKIRTRSVHDVIIYGHQVVRGVSHPRDSIVADHKLRNSDLRDQGARPSKPAGRIGAVGWLSWLVDFQAEAIKKGSLVTGSPHNRI